MIYNIMYITINPLIKVLYTSINPFSIVVDASRMENLIKIVKSRSDSSIYIIYIYILILLIKNYSIRYDFISFNINITCNNKK